MHAIRHRHRRRPAARSIARTRDRSGIILLVATAGAVLAVLLLALAATPARADETRNLAGEYPVGQARRLEVSVPFGEVRIEGTDAPRVRIRVQASCHDDDCEEFLKGLRLESSNRGGTLHVKLEGTRIHDGWDLDSDDKENGWGEHFRRGRDDDDGDSHDSDISVVVEVPRALKVDLNIGAGEVNVEGLRQDLSIDMGAGEINVRMQARHVGSVDVNMAIGETTIHQGGRTREYTRVLGGPVRWREGKGDVGIDVNIGAGDVDVTLD
jgi:hypothetical protein